MFMQIIVVVGLLILIFNTLVLKYQHQAQNEDENKADGNPIEVIPNLEKIPTLPPLILMTIMFFLVVVGIAVFDLSMWNLMVLGVELVVVLIINLAN